MSPSADPDSLGRRSPHFVEFVALVAFMMGIGAFGVDNLLPAFPALAERFGVRNANELQLCIYVYIFSFGVFQLVYGPLADVLGRRSSFLIGLTVFAAGSLLAVLAPNFEVLLLARAIQGAGGAAGRVVAIAIVRDRFAGREMARVMSLTMMVFITVPIFAPAIGALLLAFGDWHGIFLAMLVLSIGLFAWFARRMPETLRTEDRMPASLSALVGGARQTLTNRTAFGYSTAFGCLFACVMGYVGSAQQIFAGPVYGLGDLFTLVFAGVAAMMGAAALLNARLVRHFGMHRISHGAVVALVVLSAAQCAAALAYDGRPPLALICTILGLTQFAMSLAMPNFNALAMEPLGHVAGTASSLIGCYTTIVGAVLGGVIGQSFNGSVLPLALGYLSFTVLVLVMVLVTERGRLFRPTHLEAAR